jgi:negative regulator of replication initiation
MGASEDRYQSHLANLSHRGGLPKSAQQTVDVPDELRAEIAQLRKSLNERRDDLQTLRLQYAAEQKRQQAELAAGRKAHDAALAGERAAHNERVKQLNEILRSALAGHDKRAPAIARQMTAIEEALRERSK